MKWFMCLIMVLCMVGLACPCFASTTNEDGLTFATIDGLAHSNINEATADKKITATADVPIDGMYVGILRPFAGNCANGTCGLAAGLPRAAVGAVRNTGRVAVGAVKRAAMPFANARQRRLNRRN